MPALTRKPASWFKRNPQVRTQFDEAELRQLGESLKVKQLQPVLAKPDGTLIAGERRVRAAMLVGIELDVIITEENLSDTQIKLIQLAENLQRSNLTEPETYLACKELLTLNPEWKRKDLAAHLHKGGAWVTRLMSVEECIPEVREAFLAGKLGLTHVYAISRSPDQAAALAAKLGGATRDDLERGIHKRTTPTVKLARVAVPLSTGTKIVVSGPDMDLDGVIEALQSALDAAKKANKDQLDVKTFERVARDKAKIGVGHA